MPNPFLHLAVAQEVAAGTITDLPPFYLGSIAPDAIHAFANAPRPRKVASHLLHRDEQMHESDNVKNREKTLAFLAEHRDFPNRAFYLGYCVHILTDHQWAMTVYRDFLDAYTRAKAPPNASDEAFYQDVDGLSAMLCQQCPWIKEVARLLARAGGMDVLGLVVADEVDAWRRQTLKWLDAADKRVDYTPSYMALAGLQRFVFEAGRVVSAAVKDYL